MDNYFAKFVNLFECAPLTSAHSTEEQPVKQQGIQVRSPKSTEHSDASNSSQSSRSSLVRSPKSSSPGNCFLGCGVHEHIDELQRLLKESIAKVSPKSRKRGLSSKRSIEAKSSMERRCNGHLCELCEEKPCRDDCTGYFFEPLPPPFSINSTKTNQTSVTRE